MLIVAGHLIVAASDRDRYVADCAEAVAAARAADGCLDFAVSADAVDPRRVNVFERWETRALLDAFRGDGPDDGLRNRIAAVDARGRFRAPAGVVTARPGVGRGDQRAAVAHRRRHRPLRAPGRAPRGTRIPSGRRSS